MDRSRGRGGGGTAVFGGMAASTALAVLFVPVFFVIFQHLSEFKRKPKAADKKQKSHLEKKESVSILRGEKI